jgi:hypothetical protein
MFMECFHVVDKLGELWPQVVDLKLEVLSGEVGADGRSFCAVEGYSQVRPARQLSCSVAVHALAAATLAAMSQRQHHVAA